MAVSRFQCGSPLTYHEMKMILICKVKVNGATGREFLIISVKPLLSPRLVRYLVGRDRLALQSSSSDKGVEPVCER